MLSEAILAFHANDSIMEWVNGVLCEGGLVLRQFVLFFLGGVTCVGGSCPAFASSYALLVGVSGYPTLPASLRLRGPANDIALIQSALIGEGILQRNITVLADQVTGAAGLPTRANILGGFDSLARQAKTGDWVVVYLSGHGSQQPQIKKNGHFANGYQEPDGLDEIFLPYDIGAWDGRQGKVEGAIIDDEIGYALEKIASRGAYVWAVFDTCHAAGMTKAISLAHDAPATRYISPAQLGVPIDLIEGVHANQGVSPAVGLRKPLMAKDVSGHAIKTAASDKLIAFFASQKDEPAQEEYLPKLDAALKVEKQYNGVFTYMIVKAMTQWHGSFKELADRVTSQYNDRPYPTPIFAGKLTSFPKFASKPDFAQ